MIDALFGIALGVAGYCGGVRIGVGEQGHLAEGVIGLGDRGAIELFDAFDAIA